MLSITWTLGDTSGVTNVTTQSDAEKFVKELYAKKLSLIGYTPGNISRFENKVYKLNEKKYRSPRFRSWEKRHAYESEVKDVTEKLHILKQTKLSVSITSL